MQPAIPGIGKGGQWSQGGLAGLGTQQVSSYPVGLDHGTNGMQPAMPPQAGWHHFTMDTGVKPGHVPNAPHVLAQVGAASTGGASAARHYVASVYAHLHGGKEYTQLTMLATMLDLRIAQINKEQPFADRRAYEADASVEMITSELAAVDYELRTGDSMGGHELRAALGADNYLAGTVHARRLSRR